jgi:hypothetical protein
MSMRKRNTTLERFNKFVVRTETGCWGWTGQINKTGYAILRPPIDWPNGPSLAHRWSYMLFKGDIPNGALICHHCDNRVCTNPKHLYAGDVKTNAADMMARGRWVPAPQIIGPKNFNAKYTSQDVKKLCAMKDNGMTFAAISKATGIPFGSVTTLVYRRKNVHWAEEH